MQRLKQLWQDEAGTLLSTEYILLGSLLTLGLIVGISAAQTSIVAELEDYAAAVLGIDCGGLAGESDVTFDGGESGTFTP